MNTTTTTIIITTTAAKKKFKRQQFLISYTRYELVPERNTQITTTLTTPKMFYYEILMGICVVFIFLKKDKLF